MPLPTTVSEATRRLNPHLFGGFLPAAAEQPTPTPKKRITVTRNAARSAASLAFTALCADQGLSTPTPEYHFAKPRRWRFDYAWPEHKVALEVQGGIFIAGRHSRGAALLKEWEKLNMAAMRGWRILYCQPKDLCSVATMSAIRACTFVTYVK